MQKIKKLFVSCLGAIFIILVAFFIFQNKKEISQKAMAPSAEAREEIKDLFLYKEDNYENGGLIEIPITSEPSIKIGSVGVSGDAEITTYQASYDDVLRYLIHDDEYKQTNRNVDTDKLSQISKFNFHVNAESDSNLTLPLGENGIWFVRANMGDLKSEAFVIRTEVGAMATEGDDEIIIWNQNFKSKRSIANAAVTIYNLEGKINKVEDTNSDGEGVAKVKATSKADLAIIESEGNKTILPLNYKYIGNGYYKAFDKKEKETEYYVFTDRPLYKPGDNVKFKAIIREEDDAIFSLPHGKAKVEVKESSNVIFQQAFDISANGSINGEVNLPQNARPGDYYLTVTYEKDKNEWNDSTIYFNVEEYVKPEYFVEADTEQSVLIAGEKLKATVQGAYFSGQPMANQNVAYKIYATPYSDYGYRKDFDKKITWPSYTGKEVTGGIVKFDENGKADMSFETPLTKEGETSKIYTVEFEYKDESQRPSVSMVNVLVRAGEFGIYKKDFKWLAAINENFDLSMEVLDSSGNQVIKSMPVTLKTKWSHWKETQKDGKVAYEKEEENLPNVSSEVKEGSLLYSFRPEKIGSYEITTSAVDIRGNVVENTYNIWVISPNEYSRFEAYGSGTMGISVTADKELYEPGEEAKINILSKETRRDAFVSIERGRTRRYKIIELDNTQTVITEKIEIDDVPNIFINVSSFGSKDIDSDDENITVSTDIKEVNVSLKADKGKYGPGEMAVVDISTTDKDGKPISSDTAVWAMDKALFQLADSTTGNIMDTFWYQRGNQTSNSNSLEGISYFGAEAGGCFAKGTKVLMADNTEKNIEEIKAGDHVLTYASESDNEKISAKVLSTEHVLETGFLVINGKLKLTPNHILWVNNDWRQAGQIQIGDMLRTLQGNEKVTSIEWKKEQEDVYNFEVENYHTYIADKIWVHNDKGDGGLRSDLKDTAYWNPSIKTNEEGKATVSFKLPDNLTTWVVSAISATDDTRVGQQTTEILVSKNLIVRPMLPNVLQEGDRVFLGATVQNFSQNDYKMNVEATFDAGEIKNSQQTIDVKKGDSVKVYWEVLPSVSNENAKFSVKAVAVDFPEVYDGVVQNLPVTKFGFYESSGSIITNSGEYSIVIPTDARNEKSTIKIDVAASLVGSLSSAMDYLFDYPYGCVEQTTSRLVPIIIAKQNKDLFNVKKEDFNPEEAIKKGLDRLNDLQKGNGGWGWWEDDETSPFITAYVAEYLIKAKELGYAVDEQMYNSLLNYLKSEGRSDLTPGQQYLEKISKTYAFSLIEKGNYPSRQIGGFEFLTADYLSMVVIANINNGNTNPETNGLRRLIETAKVNVDNVQWSEGDKQDFGSQEVSIAMALEALIAGNADSLIIDKAAKSLVDERKSGSWQNTFATSQALQALVDYAKYKKVMDTNSSYELYLDGDLIKQGQFTDYKQIDRIEIPLDRMKSEKSLLKIKKDGSGDTFSTVAVKTFRTDRTAKRISKGLSISRSYIVNGEKNAQLAVGDVVDVQLKVQSEFDDRYVLIEDHLPSGLIPVNPRFNNEQAVSKNEQNDNPDHKDPFIIGNREVTKDGILISLDNLPKGENTISYKARVVSQGTFDVIPAVAMKMYSPDIYGRTDVEKVNVFKESQKKGVIEVNQNLKMKLTIALIIVAVLTLISGGYYVWKRKKAMV